MIRETAVTYTVSEICQLSQDEILNEIQTYMSGKNALVEGSQVKSWQDCICFLQDELKGLELNRELSLIFEYELPFEGGRRPDVILLSENKCLILEFKRKNKVLLKDQEQAIHYREDIKNYHHETNNMKVEVAACLVITETDEVFTDYLLPVLTITTFKEYVATFFSREVALSPQLVTQWLDSKYEPLRNMLVASKNLFETGELPQINRIKDSEITDALMCIDEVVKDSNARKAIVFVNGVPGSGKTLVGLKATYQYLLPPLKSIYLSGNGPLVNVLQGTLSATNRREGRVAVREMYSFKREYQSGQRIPENQFIVFDEAQRAWDEKKMKGRSEPHVLLDIADHIAKTKGKVTLLCLIGEGQSIHDGEESGMQLWQEALAKHEGWRVYTSHHFEGLHGDQIIKNELFLDTSIRNNFNDVHPMVQAILSGDLSNSQLEYKRLQKQGYVLRIVRNYQQLPGIVKKLRETAPSDHTGLFISSKVPNLMLSKIFPANFKGSFVNKNDAYKWYTKDSYLLTTAASEFLSQGLESEWPIVCFGGDYYLDQGKWMIAKNVSQKNNKKYQDFSVIMENIYRVLLTRSRKGMFLYIPRMPQLEEVYQFFKAMGVREIGGKIEEN